MNRFCSFVVNDALNFFLVSLHGCIYCTFCIGSETEILVVSMVRSFPPSFIKFHCSTICLICQKDKNILILSKMPATKGLKRDKYIIHV